MIAVTDVEIGHDLERRVVERDPVGHGLRWAARSRTPGCSMAEVKRRVVPEHGDAVRRDSIQPRVSSLPALSAEPRRAPALARGAAR